MTVSYTVYFLLFYIKQWNIFILYIFIIRAYIVYNNNSE